MNLPHYKTNIEQLLGFLYNIAMEESTGISNSPLEVIIEFINSDISIEITNKVIDKLNCGFDFHSYFKDLESVKELIEIKKTDPEIYYKAVYYESIVINIIVNVVACPYIIVLNPDDLFNSFYLQLHIKNK